MPPSLPLAAELNRPMYFMEWCSFGAEPDGGGGGSPHRPAASWPGAGRRQGWVHHIPFLGDLRFTTPGEPRANHAGDVYRTTRPDQRRECVSCGAPRARSSDPREAGAPQGGAGAEPPHVRRAGGAYLGARSLRAGRRSPAGRGWGPERGFGGERPGLGGLSHPMSTEAGGRSWLAARITRREHPAERSGEAAFLAADGCGRVILSDAHLIKLLLDARYGSL